MKPPPPPLPETNRYTAYCVVLLLFVAGVVIGLKLRNLSLWSYTSDIFMFDNVMRYTLAGHFGMDYTFGNQFGEQAYAILLLMLPLKALLGENMVLFLACFGTLFYGISGAFMLSHLRARLPAWEAFCIAAAHLLLMGMVVRGLFEAVYGFHPDMAAGFCLIIITLLEIQRREKKGPEDGRVWRGSVLLITYVILVSLKQEMALITAIYFLSLFFFTKNRAYLVPACLSLVLFALGMIYVHHAQTDFNRGNGVLINALLTGLRQDGLAFFVDRETMTFYGGVLLASIPFLCAWAVTGRINPYSAALVVTALIKSLFAFISNDFSLLTWHNFPVVVLLSGATAIQLSSPKAANRKIRTGFVQLFFLSSVALFLWKDGEFIKNRMKIHKTTTAIVAAVKGDLLAFRNKVPKNKIVAIPGMSAVEWGGYKYSFYPRGVLQPPRGIADYIVIARENTGVPIAFFNLKYQDKNEIEKFKDDFSQAGKNTYFLFFKRKHIQPGHNAEKNRFLSLFNS